MQILNLRKGLFFQMGKGQNWRVVHPEMGAKQITLNHSIHLPGNEFPQHTHDDTEDAIVVLEGGSSVRQGNIYTPIKAGDAVFVPAHEIHGTINSTNSPARLMSFQSPPDMALYRGERNRADEETPKPQSGHKSNVQIITMSKAGPCFDKPGNWRSVMSSEKGTKHLALDFIKLGIGDKFRHEPLKTECIYVLTVGKANINTDSENWDLKSDDVIFLSPGDAFFLSQIGSGPTTLIYCMSLG